MKQKHKKFRNHNKDVFRGEKSIETMLMCDYIAPKPCFFELSKCLTMEQNQNLEKS